MIECPRGQSGNLGTLERRGAPGRYTEAVHTSERGEQKRVRGGSPGSRAWERGAAEDAVSSQFVVETVSYLPWNTLGSLS